LSEGNPSEQDFLLLCELLVYPVKLLYANTGVATSVPIEVRAKLVPTWTKLIDSVAESTLEMNEFVTMVINKLVEFFEEQEAEVGVAYIIANQ